MVLLGFVKKFWILEYLCHFIIRLHIKGRLLVKPLAIAHFSIQEYEFGIGISAVNLVVSWCGLHVWKILLFCFWFVLYKQKTLS